MNVSIIKKNIKALLAYQAVVEDVIRMKQAGATYQQIADKHGFSRQRAHQIYKKYGGNQK